MIARVEFDVRPGCHHFFLARQQWTKHWSTINCGFFMQFRLVVVIICTAFLFITSFVFILFKFSILFVVLFRFDFWQIFHFLLIIRRITKAGNKLNFALVNVTFG